MVNRPQSMSSLPPPNAFRVKWVAALSSFTTNCFSSAAWMSVYAMFGFGFCRFNISCTGVEFAAWARSGAGFSFVTSWVVSHRPTKSTACSLVRWSHNPSDAMIRKSPFSGSILVVVTIGNAVR